MGGASFGIVFRLWLFGFLFCEVPGTVTTTTTRAGERDRQQLVVVFAATVVAVVVDVVVGSKFSSNYNYYDLCLVLDLVERLPAAAPQLPAAFSSLLPLHSPPPSLSLSLYDSPSRCVRCHFMR